MVGQGRRKASRGECVKTMDVVDESIEIIVNTIARYFSCVAPKPLYNIAMLEVETGINNRNNSHWQEELHPYRNEVRAEATASPFVRESARCLISMKS